MRLFYAEVSVCDQSVPPAQLPGSSRCLRLFAGLLCANGRNLGCSDMCGERSSPAFDRESTLETRSEGAE